MKPRKMRLDLLALVRAERINFYGEEGIFVPLRYNTTESGDGSPYVELVTRRARRRDKSGHTSEGVLVVPEDERERMLMSTGARGMSRPVLYEFGEEPKVKPTRARVKELLGKEKGGVK